jgi:tripartite-type tricarboxylate transporter receptor subunit TctC
VIRAAALACALLLAPWSPAHAQAWPAKPVRLIMPLPPGHSADVLARLMAESLSARLGQPVLVENRPGALTNLATQAVARAQPDGYTFLYALTSLAINPHMGQPGFDPLADLAPVLLLARYQTILVGRPSLAANTLAELLAHARSAPRGITCAHGGGVQQIGCELLKSLAKVEVTMVPFRTSVEANSVLAAGEIDLLFDPVHNAFASVRAGRVKAFARADPALDAEPFESLPALSDALPGFELTGWHAVAAPAGTPRAAIERFNRELTAALELPQVRKHMRHAGLRPAPGTPEAFGEFLRSEHARYGRIIRETGMRPQQ